MSSGVQFNMEIHTKNVIGNKRKGFPFISFMQYKSYLKSKFSLQSLFAKLRSFSTRSFISSITDNGKMFINLINGF